MKTCATLFHTISDKISKYLVLLRLYIKGGMYSPNFQSPDKAVGLRNDATKPGAIHLMPPGVMFL